MLFDSISVLLCCVIIADVAVYNPFNKSSTSEIALFPVASPEHLFYNENQHFSYYRIYIPVREGFDRKPHSFQNEVLSSAQFAFWKLVHVIQHDAGSDRNTIHRVLSDKNRHPQLFGKKLVKPV